jgi:hypothetical protein
MRRLAGVPIVLLALAVSACGGGKKADKLTKQEYASALNKICLVAADQLRELHLDTTIGTYKARGDDIVDVIAKATSKFEALTPPAVVEDAAKTFNASYDRLLADTKDAVAAATAGDRTKWEQALSKADADSQAGRAPAKEIGATGCG